MKESETILGLVQDGLKDNELHAILKQRLSASKEMRLVVAEKMLFVNFREGIVLEKLEVPDQLDETKAEYFDASETKVPSQRLMSMQALRTYDRYLRLVARAFNGFVNDLTDALVDRQESFGEGTQSAGNVESNSLVDRVIPLSLASDLKIIDSEIGDIKLRVASLIADIQQNTLDSHILIITLDDISNDALVLRSSILSAKSKSKALFPEELAAPVSEPNVSEEMLAVSEDTVSPDDHSLQVFEYENVENGSSDSRAGMRRPRRKGRKERMAAVETEEEMNAKASKAAERAKTFLNLQMMEELRSALQDRTS
ncbi:hypothetical protein HDU97_000217 [Phlyctochytrium planicorne]|nr:hypothetical protein HDU97_000217 [Phlyctochytrium planicorne]